MPLSESPATAVVPVTGRDASPLCSDVAILKRLNAMGRIAQWTARCRSSCRWRRLRWRLDQDLPLPALAPAPALALAWRIARRQVAADERGVRRAIMVVPAHSARGIAYKRVQVARDVDAHLEQWHTILVGAEGALKLCADAIQPKVTGGLRTRDDSSSELVRAGSCGKQGARSKEQSGDRREREASETLV